VLEGVFLRISALGLLRRGVRNQELCSLGKERNSVVSPKLLDEPRSGNAKPFTTEGREEHRGLRKGLVAACSYAGLCPRGIFNFLPNYDSIL
jgi:hypothetical protein